MSDLCVDCNPCLFKFHDWIHHYVCGLQISWLRASIFQWAAILCCVIWGVLLQRSSSISWVFNSRSFNFLLIANSTTGQRTPSILCQLEHFMAVENVWVSDTVLEFLQSLYTCCLILCPRKSLIVVCVIIPGFSPVSEHAIMLVGGLKWGWWMVWSRGIWGIFAGMLWWRSWRVSEHLQNWWNTLNPKLETFCLVFCYCVISLLNRKCLHCHFDFEMSLSDRWAYMPDAFVVTFCINLVKPIT